MEVARPTRVKDVNVDTEGPLKREEARKLYLEMTHWYWGSGNGLLLPDDTKELYLKVKPGSTDEPLDLTLCGRIRGSRKLLMQSSPSTSLRFPAIAFWVGAPAASNAAQRRPFGLRGSGTVDRSR